MRVRRYMGRHRPDQRFFILFSLFFSFSSVCFITTKILLFLSGIGEERVGLGREEPGYYYWPLAFQYGYTPSLLSIKSLNPLRVGRLKHNQDRASTCRNPV